MKIYILTVCFLICACESGSQTSTVSRSTNTKDKGKLGDVTRSGNVSHNTSINSKKGEDNDSPDEVVITQKFGEIEFSNYQGYPKGDARRYNYCESKDYYLDETEKKTFDAIIASQTVADAIKKYMSDSDCKQKMINFISNEVTNLDLSSKQIESLAILKNFNALETLDLRHNSIVASELFYLAKLSKLKSLLLDDNKISGLDGLAGSQSLETLSVTSNELVVLKGLETITSLKNIDVSKNQLVSMNVFSIFSNKLTIKAEDNPPLKEDLAKDEALLRQKNYEELKKRLNSNIASVCKDKQLTAVISCFDLLTIIVGD